MDSMMKANWSVQDAKNQFSRVIEAAERQPQLVTKHGKPAVVVVAASEFERLQRLAKLEAPSFVDMLLAIPQGDTEFERLKTRPRDVAF
jgi:prevent-host-death family protein